MNKVIRTENGYKLITENNSEFDCTRWFEKKTGQWHVKLSKEGQILTGRTYIRESHFDTTDVYEFETKTEHRTGLASGGWRSKLTDEEKTELQMYEDGIERLKKIASERETVKVDPNSEEGILAQIERLQKKLAKTRSTTIYK